MRGADARWAPQTYVYPSLPEGVTPSLLERKSGLVPSATSGPDVVIPTQFMYTRFRDNWIYVQTTSGSFAGLPLVRALSVVLVAKVFNPEKYEALLKLLTGTYTATGETGKVLKAYLAVLIKESYNFAGQGAFELAKFDDRRALLQGPFKEMVATFGMEAILIVTAVLLKKRVIVYSARQDVLLQYLRVMPMFAAHRQNWGILRPVVHFTDDEIAELHAAAVYVAGTTDETADSHEDLYDLFVDSATPPRRARLAAPPLTQFDLSQSTTAR